MAAFETTRMCEYELSSMQVKTRQIQVHRTSCLLVNPHNAVKGPDE